MFTAMANQPKEEKEGEELIIVTGATFFFNFNFLFAKTFIQSRAGFISLILNCLGKF